MTRREFILGSGATIAWPFTAHAREHAVRDSMNNNTACPVRWQPRLALIPEQGEKRPLTL